MFNCGTTEAQMHLDNLKGVQGEIGLRLGDNEYFGVINVGDDRELIKLCEQNGISASDKDFLTRFSPALKRHSPVKILIGQKKFTEGWNSWRVSTMGLMNIGRSEGSKLFNCLEGVRLKGYELSLKRSSYIKQPKCQSTLEPLRR
ncbi:MAG: hypothetical protein HS132_19305 [Planctomycetia bacterium]|nr:hypothetical protein [Planctomycetia bacterium]